LEEADLTGATVTATDFSRADMRAAAVAGLRAGEGAIFDHADLTETEVIDCQLPGSMWRGATLWLSVFSRAPAPPLSRDLATKDRRRDGVACTGVHLERALFDADTNCNGLTLRGCSLERATLAHTSLERLTVQGGSMAEADLSHATVSSCALRGAVLTGASLASASLSDTNLSNAVLEGADLRYASLQRVALDGASLVGASLEFADLRTATGLATADLTGARLAGARGLPPASAAGR